MSAVLLAEPSAVRSANLGLSRAIAQVGPPEQFQDPIAQVDPAQPIQIRVVNESVTDVDVGAFVRFTPTNTRIAAPGESVTFGVLHTSFLPPPIDFQVYGVLPSTMIDSMVLDTDVVAENNEIIITVAVVPRGMVAAADEEALEPAIRRGVRVTEVGEVFLF